MFKTGGGSCNFPSRSKSRRAFRQEDTRGSPRTSCNCKRPHTHLAKRVRDSSPDSSLFWMTARFASRERTALMLPTSHGIQKIGSNVQYFFWGMGMSSYRYFFSNSYGVEVN